MFGTNRNRSAPPVDAEAGRSETAIQEVIQSIKDLEKKLTKQMTCKHEKISYQFIMMGYERTCSNCGLHLGCSSPIQKAEDELKKAREEVARREQAMGIKDAEEDAGGPASILSEEKEFLEACRSVLYDKSALDNFEFIVQRLLTAGLIKIHK